MLTNIKKIEKQKTDTSYRDRIQKSLNYYTKIEENIYHLRH